MRGLEFKEALLGGWKALEDSAEKINDLNVFPVPDGDTGTNMSLTMKSATNQILKVNDITVENIAKALSNGSLMGARGNSGVILSQLMRGVYLALQGVEEIKYEHISKILLKAKEMAYKAVMKPTEGTILTIARTIAEFADLHENDYDDSISFLDAILEEGNRVLNLTPEMLPQLKEAGVVDAGGKGLLVVLSGFISVLKGEKFEYNLDLNYTSKATLVEETDDDIKFGYCTEFFIRTSGEDYLSFRKEIEELGDSIVCIGTEDVIKTHIHTNHPGKVLELALKRGSLMDIKIDNMRLQHAHRLVSEQELKSSNSSDSTSIIKEHKQYGFVSISLGEGFDNIFKEFGVDEIVSGGQTMNPSTQDIFDATEKIDADTIFIFPNNKNIIMAAQQVINLSDKEIIVIPTRTIPEGITAMFNFSEDCSSDENKENMIESLDEVKTVQITYAVRDTEIDGIKIEEGHILGMLNGSIIESGTSQKEVVLNTLNKAVDEDSILISVYSGIDVSDDDEKEIKKAIANNFGQCDLEFIRGNQPTYYYIISVE